MLMLLGHRLGDSEVGLFCRGELLQSWIRAERCRHLNYARTRLMESLLYPNPHVVSRL